MVNKDFHNCNCDTSGFQILPVTYLACIIKPRYLVHSYVNVGLSDIPVFVIVTRNHCLIFTLNYPHMLNLERLKPTFVKW